MVGRWGELEGREDRAALHRVRSSGSTIKVTTCVRTGILSLIVVANFGPKPHVCPPQLQLDSCQPWDSSAVTLSAPKLRVPVQLGQDPLETGAPIRGAGSDPWGDRFA